MKQHHIVSILAITTVFLIGGCAGMSSREVSTVTGATVGGVAGAVVGGPAAVAAGAVVGGVVGNQIGKK